MSDSPFFNVAYVLHCLAKLVFCISNSLLLMVILFLFREQFCSELAFHLKQIQELLDVINNQKSLFALVEHPAR